MQFNLTPPDIFNRTENYVSIFHALLKDIQNLKKNWKGYPLKEDLYITIDPDRKTYSFSRKLWKIAQPEFRLKRELRSFQS